MCSLSQQKECKLARESGSRAAQFVIDKYPQLFPIRTPQPVCIKDDKFECDEHKVCIVLLKWHLFLFFIFAPVPRTGLLQNLNKLQTLLTMRKISNVSCDRVIVIRSEKVKDLRYKFLFGKDTVTESPTTTPQLITVIIEILLKGLPAYNKGNFFFSM